MYNPPTWSNFRAEFANKEKCKVAQGDTGYRYIRDVLYVKLYKIINECGKKSHVLDYWASLNYFLPCIMLRYLAMGFTDVEHIEHTTLKRIRKLNYFLTDFFEIVARLLLLVIRYW